MKALSRILFRRRSGQGKDSDHEGRQQNSGAHGRRPESLVVSEVHQLPSRRIGSSDIGSARRRCDLSNSITDSGGCVVANVSSTFQDIADTCSGRPASAASKQLRKPPTKLCPRCAAMDFPSLLEWKPGQPRPWVQLSHVLLPPLLMPPSPPADDDGDPPARCPFCVFFKALIGLVPPDGLSKFTPYLRIRHAFERLDGIGEKHELARSIIMEVMTQRKALPWGYLLRAEDQERGQDLAGYLTPKGQQAAIRGRRVPPLLNPELPKCWLDFCRQHHSGKACEAPPMQQSPVAGLQLIDCSEKRVVAAHEVNADDATEYLALSYAWAQTGLDASAEVEAEAEANAPSKFDLPALRLGPDGSLPDTMPALFADAIAFTITIGARYLWIDRFCLQITPAARRQQIDAMDDIYSRASLTLVVATEDAILSGIPGLSSRREPQLSLRVNNMLYTTSLIRPDLEVASSKWASRAWTLQEGLLSRRRLIFTASQVYYQCRALHCYESISLPLRLASDWTLGRVFATGDIAARPQESGQMARLIKTYMCRELANPEERLDAFMGLLRTYERMDTFPVRHFLGLPLFHSDDFKMPGVVSETDRLAVSLGWMIRDSMSRSSTVQTPMAGHETPVDELHCHARRTISFPSWTWLAWTLHLESQNNNNKASGTSSDIDPIIPADKHNLFSFSFNLVGDTSPCIRGVSAPPGMQISVGFQDASTGILPWESAGDAMAKTPHEAGVSFLRIKTFCFGLSVAGREGRVLCLQEQDDATGATALGLTDGRLVLDMLHGVLPGESVPEAGPEEEQGPETESSAVYNSHEPSSEANHDHDGPCTQASPDMHLLGILVSGRNWNGHDGSGCQLTVLICTRRKLDQDGAWVRLGALALDCASLIVDCDGDGGGEEAVVRGLKTDEEGALEGDVRMRVQELDLY
ncbi:hypothetical protein E4U13_007055 [Claviceps humidiphila]|uniref:Heterokaryon incompatibility domain-containing protein n=1 Tax=Claviceps humidiphila TaxID=1294629 RepID=A0A9P7Q644_9HYPO|nr:hypothetical protein E4U13_007055 [Claviceps humidiphila]